MTTKQINATRVCDICGDVYYGEQYGPYGDNICNNCLKSDDLPLLTEDSDESEIPESMNDELDGDNIEDDEDGN